MSIPATTDPDRERATLEELAAAKSDLTSRIGRQIDFLLAAHAGSEQPLSVADAAARSRSPIVHCPLEQGHQHVGCHAIANLAGHYPERARDVWAAVKGLARQELKTGHRTARSLEGQHASPFGRMPYLVILEGLRESLSPRGGAEDFLVQ